MEVKSRMFNIETDYAIITEWYNKRDIPVMEKDMLSQFGIMISVNDKDIVSCFLYPILGASWCMFEGAIANPTSTKAERELALLTMGNTMHEMARGMGFKKILAISKNSGIITLAKKFGYTSDEKEYFNYWGVL
jgi:hypothetical protein